MKKILFVLLLVANSAFAQFSAIKDLNYTIPDGAVGDPLIMTNRVAGRIVATGPKNTPSQRNNCPDHLNGPDQSVYYVPITVNIKGNINIHTCYKIYPETMIIPKIGDKFEIIVKTFYYPGAQDYEENR